MKLAQRDTNTVQWRKTFKNVINLTVNKASCLCIRLAMKDNVNVTLCVNYIFPYANLVILLYCICSSLPASLYSPFTTYLFVQRGKNSHRIVSRFSLDSSHFFLVCYNELNQCFLYPWCSAANLLSSCIRSLRRLDLLSYGHIFTLHWHVSILNLFINLSTKVCIKPPQCQHRLLGLINHILSSPSRNWWYWIQLQSLTVSCPQLHIDLQGSALLPSSTSRTSRLIRWQWPGAPLPRPLTPSSWATLPKISGIAPKSPSMDPKPELHSETSFPQESISSPWLLSVVMSLKLLKEQLLQVDVFCMFCRCFCWSQVVWKQSINICRRHESVIPDRQVVFIE